ncbi:protein argonaute-2-like [Anopheles moucheti]|uniref:protein argonaute-2-like n=1 Tax=Anopheles moucheti TaxID=186751 RepID=UPI0022F05D5F|nr:protein argonaute-2-like [Anopheles moucheti]
MGKKKQQKIALEPTGHSTWSQESAAQNQQPQQQQPSSRLQDAQPQGTQKSKEPQQGPQGSQKKQNGHQQRPQRLQPQKEPQQQHMHGSQQYPQGSQQQKGPQQYPQAWQQHQGPQQRSQALHQEQGPQQHLQTWQQQGGPQGPQQQHPQGSQQQKGPQHFPKGWHQQQGPQQHLQTWQQQGGPQGPQQQHPQGSQQQKGPQHFPKGWHQQQGLQQHPQTWQQQRGPQGHQQQQHPQGSWQQKGPQQNPQALHQHQGPEQHPQTWQQHRGPEQRPQALHQHQGPQQHPQALHQQQGLQQQQGSQQHPQTWQQQQGPPKQSKQYKQKKEKHPQSHRVQEKDGPPGKKHPEHTAPGGGAPHHGTSVSSSKSDSSGDGTLGHTEENIERITKQKHGRTNLRPVLVRRGAQGTGGTKVTVEANFFRLQLDQLKDVAYHYDVAIEPDRPKKFLRAVFAQFCRENYPGALMAYDGQKSAYTTRKLTDKQAKLKYQPADGGNAKEYSVQMKEVAQLDLTVLKTYMHSNDVTFVKPMSAIQCLDVVLRCAYETNSNFVRFKKCVYMPDTKNTRVGEVYELWYGLFQSAVLGSRPYLNLDVSHKAFPCAGLLLDVIRYLNRGTLGQLDLRVVNKLQSFVKGMDVIYKNPTGITRRMRCNGLRDPANKQTFRLDDGTRLTVADYFAQHLNHQLTHPYLPVLHVGSTVRSIYVPVELCEIPGGQTLTKNPDGCTRDIISCAATNTQTRKERIKNLAAQIQYNKCPTLKDFGIAVGNEFEKVPARIIGAPSIEYARNEKIAPRSGVWRAEGKNFLQPSTERAPLRWRILNLDTKNANEATVKKFGEKLQQQAKKCNVRMEPFDMGSTYVLVRNPNNALRDIGTLLEGIKKDNPTITIVILPRSGDVYAKVKQKAELASEKIGLLTQCIRSDTVAKKGNDVSTLNNIILKLNAKTNGVNHCVAQDDVPALGRGKVMYMGADVTHPLSDDAPSVVGVTASHDLIGFRYNHDVRVQRARDEMIRDLENIAHRQLLLYQQHNGDLPERIMYYRDGVSDGQFAEILSVELEALHAAIARAKHGYKPAVTFIVVQKRHHTRFFPHGNCPSDGKNRNVPPGTVVDSEITLPTRYEFYLVSHASILGVAKPTKYVVLHDDSNSEPDELQTMTYNLCHMFARCNRAVSYPAPTYYAHLAAFRGRVHIKDRHIDLNNLDDASRKIEIISTVADNNPMFFV